LAGLSCLRLLDRLPLPLRIVAPSVFAVPWIIAALATSSLHVGWLILYLVIPVAMAGLLALAARLDPEQRGHLLDFLVLIPLGLAVDLRWLQPAWPPRYDVLGKLILLDAGLYGFLAIRRLSGVGFDLRLRLRDLAIGLREFAFYAPIVALPEEIFFRGWMQNLLERRLGRTAALVVTACLFGLAHFNKRALHFNWQYVLLAAIAGVFYGRAWRADRRIGASAITHATVDTLWGALLR
jgi:membrane protease YdiL (CAAX protease family)